MPFQLGYQAATSQPDGPRETKGPAAGAPSLPWIRVAFTLHRAEKNREPNPFSQATRELPPSSPPADSVEIQGGLEYCHPFSQTATQPSPR